MIEAFADRGVYATVWEYVIARFMDECVAADAATRHPDSCFCIEYNQMGFLSEWVYWR
jgi:hypothetical protein